MSVPRRRRRRTTCTAAFRIHSAGRHPTLHDSEPTAACAADASDECVVDGRPTHRCWVYPDATRRARRLPRNRQLERLAPALGWPRDQSGDWLGPALITERDLHWADRDVPSVVLTAALPPD